jgi:hypothetical protein
VTKIVESYEDLEKLLEYKAEKCFVSLILQNDKYHSKLNEVVAVYLHPYSEKKGYIIGIQHTDCINLVYSRVLQLLSTFEYLYTISRKELMYHAGNLAVTDVSLLATLLDNRKLDIRTPVHTIDLFYRYQTDYKDVNSIVPILKLYERAEHLYNSLKSYLKVEIPEYFHFYNKTAVGVFYLIEQTGIRVLPDIVDTYKLTNPEFNIESSTVYTSYNLYNMTTRPTNSFNNINFTALPKEGSYRKVYIPKNDYFVQFDFDGYHLRLLCELLGYELTSESAHTQMAKQYFSTENITQEQYQQAKDLNFAAMYGKVPKEYQHFEFFKRLKVFTEELWKTYQSKGFIEDPISKRRIKPDKSIMNAPKLVNYLIQSLETSRNILVLKELLRYLTDKQSQVVLYVYDAIIIDFSKGDTKEVLQETEKILSENSKYPVKFSYSKDLTL